MIGLQYTPYTLPVIVAAIISGFLAYVIWRHRDQATARPFIVLMVGLVQWILFYVVELAATDPQTKISFSALKYIGVTTVPASWFYFSLVYTSREKYLTQRTVLLLCIEPMLTVLVAVSNPVHHLFWTSQTFTTDFGFISLTSNPGNLFWVHAVYSYTLVLLATLFLIQAFIRSSNLYRGQISALLIGAFVPWIGNFLSITGLSPFPALDLTPIAFTFLGIMIFWSMARFQLMNLVPVARDLVFESIGDGVFVFNIQNKFVDINPAAVKLLGFKSAGNAIGKTAFEVLPGQEALLVKLQDVQDPVIEIAAPTGAGGALRHFQLIISPLKNRRGELTGRLFVTHEITDQKQASELIKKQNEILLSTNRDLIEAQKQAEESNRLKTEFLATMSHELRTPLNAIIGYADLLLTGLVGDLTDKQNDYLKRVTANGDRLLSLINDILDVAKIEASRMDLVTIEFSPVDLLNNVSSQLRTLADQKGLRFETKIAADLPPRMKSDPKRLEQILVNLIGNAVRFTETGYVRVELARVNDAQWKLTVEDTGIGIPANALEYIFDEFRQVDGSYRRKFGGTGLGLAIVRKLATLMGGNVQVQSEVGKGSIFTVQLPIIVTETPLVKVGD